MNSFRPNRGRRRLLALTALVAVIFLLDALSGGKVRAILRAGAARLWEAGERAGASLRVGSILASRRALEEENASLKERLAQLQERAAAFQLLEGENDSLRAMAHLAASAPGLTAPVISSFRASPYGTFMIGAGSTDGVGLGSLVLAGDQSGTGFVIGRVSEVAPHTSLVSELFAPGAKSDALLDGAGIVVEGQGGGNARANAPRDLKIAVGDALIAPELGRRPIGIVGKVESDQTSGVQRIYIILPTNLWTLGFVYIVGAASP